MVIPGVQGTCFGEFDCDILKDDEFVNYMVLLSTSLYLMQLYSKQQLIYRHVVVWSFQLDSKRIARAGVNVTVIGQSNCHCPNVKITALNISRQSFSGSITNVDCRNAVSVPANLEFDTFMYDHLL